MIKSKHSAVAYTSGRAVHRLIFTGADIICIAIPDLERGRLSAIVSDPLWQDCELQPLHLRVIIANDDLNELMAGLIAERYSVDRDWAAVDRLGYEPSEHCTDDDGEREMVRTRLNWLCELPSDKSSQDIWQGYWSDTVKWVKSYWDDIADLSDLLLLKGKIEKNELDEWWRHRGTIEA